ncbi:MAG TPA: iron-containing alcohol dehydrogenase [Clostridia bacterium]|nr:iron-containing alcohol dehydrogenase [Clostridia bacterium]
MSYKNFSYSFPTQIIFGKDSINQLESALKAFDIDSLLIVYGGNSIKQNGIYDRVISSLGSCNINYYEHGGCTPNPKSSFVDKGVEKALKNKVQLILAVGGGSVIDAAKAIALLSVNENSSGIWPYMLGLKKFAVDALPIGVILTVSGTGSEGNGAFVISNEDTLEKIGRSHLSARPKFAICDPCFTFSLSSWQTACNCADIMSHLLEQLFVMEENTDLIDELIVAALKNVMINTDLVLQNPNDYDARANLMLAATYSLSYMLSSGRTSDWEAHKIEHVLSGMYNVAHGAGMACIFPYWLEYAAKEEKIANKILLIGQRIFDEKDTIISESVIHKVIYKFTVFFNQVGLPTNLYELLGNYPDIKCIANKVTQSGELGTIVKIDYNSCIDILAKAVGDIK